MTINWIKKKAEKKRFFVSFVKILLIPKKLKKATFFYLFFNNFLKIKIFKTNKKWGVVLQNQLR